MGRSSPIGREQGFTTGAARSLRGDRVAAGRALNCRCCSATRASSRWIRPMSRDLVVSRVRGVSRVGRAGRVPCGRRLPGRPCSFQPRGTFCREIPFLFFLRRARWTFWLTRFWMEQGPCDPSDAAAATRSPRSRPLVCPGDDPGSRQRLQVVVRLYQWLRRVHGPSE